MGRSARVARVDEPVDGGMARLVPDPDSARGWTLLVDGAPQSYVDLDDPRHLEFEYVRRLASVVDSMPDTPQRVLHLGGGGLTLPRYVAATRPRWAQRVVERDVALTALVRRMLPLPKGADIRVRVADARAAVEATPTARFDLVITDVFDGGQVPATLTSAEFAAQVARILRPAGRYAVNLADGAGLAFTRGQVATLRGAFTEVALLAEPGVLRGRRYGNLVLVAGQDALPLPALSRSGSQDIFPARLLCGSDLDRFVAGARPVTDTTATRSPAPPRDLFDR